MGIIDNILTKITNINDLKVRLRTKLKSMYIVEDGASLEDCVAGVENIEYKNSTLSYPLRTLNEVYYIPKGYHSGSQSVRISPNVAEVLIPENIREGVNILGVTGALSEEAPIGFTFENLISDGSFELNTTWITWEGANSFSTTEKYVGNRSFVVESSNLASQSISTPVVGHKYYAREYIKSTGDINPDDCRFEIHGGDGAGLNWVFGYNRGNFPDWTMISGIAEIDVLNTSSYLLRTFALNVQSTFYIDGIMLIDLTACCGAGNEPSKEWCDLNIPYFEGQISLEWETEDASETIIKILDRSITSITDANTLKLGTYALAGCSSLTEASFPSLNEVGNFAFALCEYLGTVDIPNVRTINAQAFNGCSMLSGLDAPYLETIGSQAFYDCTRFASINAPNVTSLGSNAFYGCGSLTEVNFPLMTGSSWNYAFDGCSALTRAYLPAAVKVPTYAFRGCTSLSDVDVSAATTIDSNAFYGCTNLSDIELPATTKISTYAFRNCSNLNEITLSGSTMCTLANINAFSGTPIGNGDGMIYVPSNLVDQYKSDSVWVDLADIIYEI